MMNVQPRCVVLLVTVICVGAVGTPSLHGQVDQSALARRILEGSAGERSRVVEAARSLGPQNLGPELRAALITALEREGEIRAQRYHASKRGEALQPFENPEFITSLSSIVAELRDANAIPAFIGALGTGSIPSRALAAFGEKAVPALLNAVRSSESIEYVVDDAMLTLRFMIEGAAPRPLADTTLDAIRDAAKQRLTGEQYFTTLWEAMDLASAFSDPDLKRILKSLASNRDSVLARGIEDADLIQETQRLAAQRLAGVPPTLRWR